MTQKRANFSLTFPGIAAEMKSANVSGQGKSLYCSHHRLTTNDT